MAKVSVLDWNKKKVGDVELTPEVFETSVRKYVIHGIVRWQLASRRQGTHKAKTKGEVRGGGKKPYKQKGTGNARQGSTRSPLLRGGGVHFAPVNRDYSYTIPKKIKKMALRSTLSHLNKEGRLTIIDSMSSEGKTNELSKRLKNFGLEKAMLVTNEVNEGFQKASNNLKKIKYTNVSGLNVYDMLKFDNLILTKDAVEAVVSKCTPKAGS